MKPSPEWDGKLAKVAGFTQRIPTDGAPSTQRTDAYLGYDDKNLYAIFVCFDTDPQKLRARLSRREDIIEDDSVEIMGLMQLMPGTARSLNVTNPFDPEQNVDAGVRHLKKLLESFGGDVKLSLAAYNAGAGAVARSAGIPRFAETQNYVRRITSIYYGGSDPNSRILGNPILNPVRVQRDSRGVLYISNTD